MRTVVVVIAALVSLGLAAFALLAAHNGIFPLWPRPAATTAADQGNNALAAAPSQEAPVRTVDATKATSLPVPPAPSAAAPIPPVAHAPAPAAPEQAAENTPAPSSSGTAAAVRATPGTTDSIAACDQPGGMGLSRIVEIDTTGGPGFGFEHFKQYDFLRPNEVVLTFDDGPWPENTPAILKALADNCLKATFFEIGKHALWHPEIAKQVAAAGNTIGSHTWSHKDLAKNPYAMDVELASKRSRWA